MQAKLTADFVVNNYQVDKVYSSDLDRAYETAKAVADLLGLEVSKEKGMREIFGGAWEGVEYAVLEKTDPEAYALWLKDVGHSRCTEGESVEELGQRIMSTLTRIAEANDGKTVLVATHATPIRVMQSLVETGGLDEMKDIPWVTNASVTLMEYTDGKWECIAVSMDKHLGELRTALPKNV